MILRIGDTAPDFDADTTAGRIRFHDWIGRVLGCPSPSEHSERVRVQASPRGGPGPLPAALGRAADRHVPMDEPRAAGRGGLRVARFSVAPRLRVAAGRAHGG